ncbi:hypothetical protein T05_7701, partial [Trichinella murrelli]
MKRSGAVLNEVCSLAINHHKMSCQAAYPLEQPLTIIMSTLRTLICDASGKKICITIPYYVCAITDGKLGCSSGGKSTSILLGYSVHCYAISLAGGQLQFRSSTPSVNN